MTKYECGHTKTAVNPDGTDLHIAAYFYWKKTFGFDGDKSLCFDCWEKDYRERWEKFMEEDVAVLNNLEMHCQQEIMDGRGPLWRDGNGLCEASKTRRLDEITVYILKSKCFHTGKKRSSDGKNYCLDCKYKD